MNLCQNLESTKSKGRYRLKTFKGVWKSKTGIKTPKPEIDLIESRLKEAEYLHKSRIENEI